MTATVAAGWPRVRRCAVIPATATGLTQAASRAAPRIRLSDQSRTSARAAMLPKAATGWARLGSASAVSSAPPSSSPVARGPPHDGTIIG